MIVSEGKRKIIKNLNTFKVKRFRDDETPVLIEAPDGTRGNALRIYGYGGDIGTLPISDGVDFSLLSEGYVKYLDVSLRPDWLLENEVILNKAIPVNMESIDKDDYCSILNRMITDHKIESLTIPSHSEWYLTLALAASCVRFTKKNKKRGERWVQQIIAKWYQGHFGEMNGKPVIITDVEFDMPISDSRKKQKALRTKAKSDGNRGASKPDFIMFDGEHFGYVEMKYDGESMDNCTANALDWHFLDFYSAMKADLDKQIDAYETCLNRLEILLDCNIINEEMKGVNWRKKLEDCRRKVIALKNGQIKEDLFWCGFLFVGGDKKGIAEKIKYQLLDPDINNYPRLGEKRRQNEETVAADVIEKMQGIDVYCQYCSDTENGDIKLNMSKSLLETYEFLCMD